MGPSVASVGVVNFSWCFRYFNRIARHPLLRKDPYYRAFLQETDVPKALKGEKSNTGAGSPKDQEQKDKRKSNSKWRAFVNSILLFRSRFTVKELDPWFQTRSCQLEETAKRLTQIKKTLSVMSSSKSRLAMTSTEFRQNLVLLLTSRPSKERDLRNVVHKAIESHKVMATIHDDQSQADVSIEELSGDYIQMVIAAQEVLSRRRLLQQEVTRAKSRNRKALAKEEKKEEGDEGEEGEGSDEEEDEEDEEDSDTEDEDDSEEETDEDEDEMANSKSQPISVSKQMKKMHRRFEKVSQTIRRELEHFDFVMKDEFEQAFANYNAMYFNALTNPRIGSGVPRDKMGLIANNLKQVGYENKQGRHGMEDLE